jgi:hypothetical protein
MNTQFDVNPYVSAPPEPPREPSPAEEINLLRQIVDLQREQVAMLRALAASQDAGSRWRAFLARWKEDLPELPEACREAIQVLERSYGGMIAELTDHLRQNGAGALDNDFAMQEFLDRYGMRLAQLGTIVNLVGPLAEAGSQSESS